MLRSMTGFGRCLVESEGFTQQWEVKSVNSRHLDLKWRLPMSVRSLEPRLEKVVRRFASRGRVDISLTLQYTGGTGPAPRFDAMQAEAMLDSLKELAARRGESFTPDYNALLALPGLWGDAGDEVDESLHPSLLKAIMHKIMNSGPAYGGQFIITTHESNLLDYDIYRQDEIWFVEKNNGSTELYPLTDFKPRADLQLQKGYLMGRFGAVPFLANLKDLNWQ